VYAAVKVDWNSLKWITLVVLLMAGWSSAGAQQTGSIPAAKFTEQGTERCLDCHGGEQMTLIADSPHGDVSNPHTPYAQRGCESCHGKGSLHVSRARGGAGFPELIQFKRRGASVQRQNEACLNCHMTDMDELEGMAWAGSLHDTGRMTCGTCHTIHVAENLMAVKSEQEKNCAGCHEEQIAAHPKFEDKGIVFDKLTCGSCHDVHQLERKPE
jgi:DmsE family decaheme c-type cytochrome